MPISSWILLAMGVLGAADILFFHKLAHNLHAHPPARAELITHSLRGPTYAALFAMVPNFEFHGAWFVALMAVLAFDLAISIADFWIEPTSRRALGGLPRGEYLLHVFLAMCFGALVYAVVHEGGAGLGLPTGLHWIESGPPFLLRSLLAVMAIGVLWSGLSDALAVRRLARAAP
ncbi:MAG: hypothetical protein JNL28_09830 [Planctomycetes bacterium]|nr:hypothetical protein [Planctomycetota bacterium]